MGGTASSAPEGTIIQRMDPNRLGPLIGPHAVTRPADKPGERTPLDVVGEDRPATFRVIKGEGSQDLPADLNSALHDATRAARAEGEDSGKERKRVAERAAGEVGELPSTG